MRRCGTGVQPTLRGRRAAGDRLRADRAKFPPEYVAARLARPAHQDDALAVST